MWQAKGATCISYSFCKRSDGKVTHQAIAGLRPGTLKDQFCHGRLTIYVKPLLPFRREQ